MFDSERPAVHEAASAASLVYTSSEIDSERRLAVGNPSAPQVRVAPVQVISKYAKYSKYTEYNKLKYTVLDALIP